MVVWIYSSLLLFSLLRVGAPKLNYYEYHDYESMTEFLTGVNATYSIAHLYSIGESYGGRQLWVMKMSGGVDRAMRPHVKLVANVHGNEAVGRELLLRLIEYLVEKFNAGDERVRRLLDYAHIHILPSLNPDGFETLRNLSQPGVGTSEAYGEGRENYNGVDLNTDFNSNSPQKETSAVRKWMQDIPFVLSASIGGGAIAGWIPFDSEQSGSLSTPDDDVFEDLANVYVSEHLEMLEPQPCPPPGSDSDYSMGYPPGGVNIGGTNPVIGSMMDYNYIVHGCMEVSFQISCHKYPWPSKLPEFWEDNRESLLAYLEAVRRGVRGLVLDEQGHAVPNATLRVQERDAALFHSSAKGEFWRLLNEGQYYFIVSAEGFESRGKSVTVTRPGPEEWPRTVNITLYRTPRTPAPSLTVPEPTSTEHNVAKNEERKAGKEFLPVTSDGEAKCYWQIVLVLCLFVVFLS